MKVAGIAGGVGTTVVATLLGAEDCGTDVEGADIVVARNDYRCAKALIDRCPSNARVLLILEDGRTLSSDDFEAILGRSVVAWPANPTLARADDAGLLEAARMMAPTARLKQVLQVLGLPT